jgi:hypothetical protein
MCLLIKSDYWITLEPEDEEGRVTSHELGHIEVREGAAGRVLGRHAGEEADGILALRVKAECDKEGEAASDAYDDSTDHGSDREAQADHDANSHW